MKLSIYQHGIFYTNSVIACVANSFLIYLIVFHSRRGMGMYRVLMFMFACFNILYPLAHVIVAPVDYAQGRFVAIFSTGIIAVNPTAARLGVLVYGSFFAQSLMLLAFHFVYRYILLCRNHLMNRLKKRSTILAVFVLYVSMGILWSLNMHFLMGGGDCVGEYEEKFQAEFNMTTQEVGLIGGYFMENTSDGISLCYEVCVGMVIIYMILGTTFSVIVVCGVKIARSLKQSKLSPKAQKLQVQLFKALLLQTFIPCIFEYIPCGLAFSLPFFDVQTPTTFLTVLVSFYPVFEPIVMIYFVGEYRRAVRSRLHLILGVRCSGTRGSSTISVDESTKTGKRENEVETLQIVMVQPGNNGFRVSR